MPEPRISVLMPVYNGERYLKPAIESVLGQTVSDFELIVIDDGSTDSSLSICQGFQDARIRLVESEKNRGLIATLNRGLDLAKGEYIVRMDCDDISLGNRFGVQLAFMEKHPEIGLCGSWYERFSDRERGIIRMPTSHDELRLFLLFDNPFLHSSMFLRRSLFEEFGWRFDGDFRHCEDYELWARCSARTGIANIPEVLVRYRVHAESVCNRFGDEVGGNGDQVRRRQLEILGLDASEAEIELHNRLVKFQPFQGRGDLEAARSWLDRVLAFGSDRYGIRTESFGRHLARFWYGACGKAAGGGLDTWRLFRTSPLGRCADFDQQWKLLLRCALGRPIPASPGSASP